MKLVRPNIGALVNNSLELLVSFAVLGINTARLLAVELQRNYPLQTMLASHRKRVEKYSSSTVFSEGSPDLDASLIGSYAKRLGTQETNIYEKLSEGFMYRREQLIDLRNGQEWIANYYADPLLQQAMLTTASVGYDLMQNQCIDRLQEYMQWLGLQDKEEYLERFIKQLQSLPDVLRNPQRLIAKRNYHRRKRDSLWDFDYELMTNAIGGYAGINKEGVAEAKVNVNKCFVESYATHEIEHVAQEILIGNENKKENTEASFGYSPYYYGVVKQDFGINTIYMPSYPIGKRHTPLKKFLGRMGNTITDLNRSIEQQQKGYILSLQEILARVQEIRMYLSKNNIMLDATVLTLWDSLRYDTVSSEVIRKNKYEYAVARARGELCPYISDREKFIVFVTSMF